MSDVEDRVEGADDQVDDQIDENGDDVIDPPEGAVDENAGGEADDQDVGVADAQAKADAARRKIEARAAERREEAARLAAETASATARETARAQAEVTRQAEEARREEAALANMTQEQRDMYALAKQVKGTNDSVAQMRALTQSATDQGRFDRLLTRKPQYEKYADEVERRHQNTLSGGAFVPREAILAHLIGEAALKAERVDNQRQAAGRRVREARGQTGRAARGDSTGRTTTGKSVVQRAEEADWAI